jgi:hypothetical protein
VKGLFQAIEARFNAYPMLRLKGRKLYEGFEEQRVNVTKPYTELNAALVERLDTFSSDIETWELKFRFHAKGLKGESADDWVDAMTDAFKDANILAGQFVTAGTRMLIASVPKLTDGLFDATMTFRLIFKRNLNSPLVRHG